ncbi:MAG TPA: hypothetical protein VEP90_08520, partial [Methylomirabilota bacterium]|nr:hypothetical protein [Methylomirabilota bacterium]
AALRKSGGNSYLEHWKQGNKAGLQGLESHHNPHPPGSDEANQWEEGRQETYIKKEALGYKTKKSSKFTRGIQKVINTIDKISIKKKPVKVNELAMHTPNSIDWHVERAKHHFNQSGEHHKRKYLYHSAEVKRLSKSPKPLSYNAGQHPPTSHVHDILKAEEEGLNEFHYGSPHQWQPDVKVLGKTKHIAAKDHDCGVCKQKIPPGEVHNKIAYMDSQKKFHAYRYHGGCSTNEDAPTNSMGGSDSTHGHGPIDTFDPMLKVKQARTKMMSRFSKFLYGTLRKTNEK